MMELAIPTEVALLALTDAALFSSQSTFLLPAPTWPSLAFPEGALFLLQSAWLAEQEDVFGLWGSQGSKMCP